MSRVSNAAREAARQQKAAIAASRPRPAVTNDAAQRTAHDDAAAAKTPVPPKPGTPFRP